MTADNQGNDLNAVKYVTTSKIIIAPYDATANLTAAMIATDVADPITTIGSIFDKGSAVGLITSDGAPQDARDSDDATEFHQPGYMLNADPSLTLAFTVAEDNEIVRAMTIGTPDENGVYHVADTIQDTKWIAYQETHYKNGTIRRRLGVLQTTGSEPAQDTRGEVSGIALTCTWQKDSIVDGGNSRYLQSYYTPGGSTAEIPVASITAAPSTLTIQEGKTATFTVTVTPDNATDPTVHVTSSDIDKATATVTGKTVTVNGVAATGTGKTVDITATAGGKNAIVKVTVTAAGA